MALENIPNQLGQTAATTGQDVLAFVGEPNILIIGIIFVILAVLVLYLLKQVLVNSVLGLVAWVILTYFFNVQLPFWVSLIVSIVFGLAGIGVLLVLRFLGLF